MIGDIVGGALGGGIVALFGLTKDGKVAQIPIQTNQPDSLWRTYPEVGLQVSVVGTTDLIITPTPTKIWEVQAIYYRAVTAGAAARNIYIYLYGPPRRPTANNPWMVLAAPVAVAAAQTLNVALIPGCTFYCSPQYSLGGAQVGYSMSIPLPIDYKMKDGETVMIELDGALGTDYHAASIRYREFDQ